MTFCDGKDICPALITFLLKANIFEAFIVLEEKKKREFVHIGPHTITAYLNKKKKYKNITLSLNYYARQAFIHHLYCVGNFNWSSYRNLKSITLTLFFFLVWGVCDKILLLQKMDSFSG